MLEDLRSQYKTAEQALSSRRGARQATVSLQLTGVKQAILGLEQDYATAIWGLSESGLEPFAAIADLARAIKEAEQAEQQSQLPLRRPRPR